jgi:CheY-like chemotaxis protein
VTRCSTAIGATDWHRLDSFSPAPASASNDLALNPRYFEHFTNGSEWLSVCTVAHVRPMLNGLRILLVDDDPIVRALYVYVLQEAGAAVVSSGLATEALQLIDLQAPDAVVTDLKMPEHDGIWLLEELRARLPGVPVIAVSGRLHDAGLVDLRRLGFFDVLAKPIGLSVLTETVARAAGR